MSKLHPPKKPYVGGKIADEKSWSKQMYKHSSIIFSGVGKISDDI